MARAIGLDLSKYDLSFRPDIAAKVPDFVIQRSGYGLRRDELFDVIYQGVARIPVRGAYHYLSSGADWKAQADFYLSNIQGRGFLFHVGDFEGAYNNLNTRFAADALSWVEYVAAQTNQRALLYTNTSLYNEWMGRYYPARAAALPLWIAQYPYILGNLDTITPRMPTDRADWSIWQITDRKFNGRDYGTPRAALDVDLYNGTLEEMRVWLGIVPPAQPPAPVPVPVPQPNKYELAINQIKEILAGLEQG